MLIAAADITDVAVTLASGKPTGRIGGSLVRDSIMIALAVAMVVKRGGWVWAGWVLIALLALSTVRLLGADEPLEYTNVLGPVGAILLSLPAARAWWTKRPDAGPKTP